MLLRFALPVALVAGLMSATPAAAAPEVEPKLAAVASAESPATEQSTESIVIDDKKLADEPQVEVSGTLQIAEADSTLNADGTPVAGSEHHEVAFLLTDAGDTIALSGELPEEAVSGSTVEGTVAVSAEASEALDVASDVLAAATVEPLAASSTDAQALLASASTQQVALPIAEATIVAPAETVVATPARHKFYVAIVRPSGSPISTTSTTSTAVRSLVSRVSKYWTAQSGGVIASIETASMVRYNSAYSCSQGTTSIRNMWTEAGSRFSSDPNSFFGDGSRRHLVVLTPDGSSATGPCAAKLGFSGLATIGQSSASGGLIHSTVGSSLATATLAHEFGHNLSLGHANVALCANRDVVEAPGSGCVVNEYYDLYDVMGATVVGQSGVPSLSLPAKQRLGFISTDDVTTAALDGGGSETFTEVIRPISSTSGKRGFAITDPITNDSYWVELRSGTGQDSGLVANRDAFNVCITTCPSWRYSYGDGVRVLKQLADDTRQQTYAIAAPSTAKRGVTTRELALDSLDSFSTSSGGVHVDVNWVTPTAASVTVRLTATPTLVPSPKGMLVTGYATVGESLIANHQFFRQPGAQLSYQWLRNGEEIAGATSTTYEPGLTDVAAAVSVRITGSLAGFASSSVESAPVTVSTVLQRASLQQPLTIIKPSPENVAGSALTPTILLVSDAPTAQSGIPSLRWTAPIYRLIKTAAFDEDGVSLTRIPWVVGSVEQTVTGTFLGRSSEAVDFTPAQSASIVRFSLSSTSATTATRVRATVSFVTSAWYEHPPTGVVNIYHGSTIIASRQLIAGTGTIYLPRFATTGTKKLKAVYVGDVNFTGDASVVRSVTIR